MVPRPGHGHRLGTTPGKLRSGVVLLVRLAQPPEHYQTWLAETLASQLLAS